MNAWVNVHDPGIIILSGCLKYRVPYGSCLKCRVPSGSCLQRRVHRLIYRLSQSFFVCRLDIFNCQCTKSRESIHFCVHTYGYSIKWIKHAKNWLLGLLEGSWGESKAEEEGICDLQWRRESESQSRETRDQDCMAGAEGNPKRMRQPCVIYYGAGKVNHRAGKPGIKIAWPGQKAILSV